MKSHLEFTTIIGNGCGGPCCVNCKRYCPQEIIVEMLQGVEPQILQLDDFKNLLSTVPKDVGVIFGGVSEPFQNPATTEMISHSNSTGHEIICFSTLTGLNLYDAISLCKIPFEKFVIHLPDSCGNAHIPLTGNYETVLIYLLSHVKNKRTMSMDESFITDGHEDIFRGHPPEPKKGKVACYKHEVPDYMVLPNGDVFYCCQCKGMTEKVGNLYEETYPELAAKHLDMTKRLQEDPNSLCHVCSISQTKWKYDLISLKNRWFGERPILDIIFG
jgi:radical SAM protein with 4Fe4S-binding SPASM domain